MTAHTQITIHTSRLHGAVMAPRSKSSMQRACAAALLRRGESMIHHPGRSNDDVAALDVIRQLGAQVTDEGNTIHIISNGVQPVAAEIHCGESGLGVRMFTPIAALAPQPVRITGAGSLLKRPVDFFDTVLPQLGIAVQSAGGKLPVTVHGPLQPRNIEVDGSLSSQFLTGLLMAYSAAGAHDVTITVHNLASRPYVDLTLEVMRRFGLHVPENDEYKYFKFSMPQQQPVNPVHYTVEGDWSGGAFLLVAGFLSGPVTVQGLDINSTQADKAILEALRRSGARIDIGDTGITVHNGLPKAFAFDAADCPDLFPPLVALAAYGEGTSYIKGVHRLTHKESDRAATLQEEFGKMGVFIVLNGDVMEVHGAGFLRGGQVKSHNDHRIAMACAVAALAAETPTAISGAGAVSKSYPEFFEHLRQLGANVNPELNIQGS